MLRTGQLTKRIIELKTHFISRGYPVAFELSIVEKLSVLFSQTHMYICEVRLPWHQLRSRDGPDPGCLRSHEYWTGLLDSCNFMQKRYYDIKIDFPPSCLAVFFPTDSQAFAKGYCRLFCSVGNGSFTIKLHLSAKNTKESFV